MRLARVQSSGKARYMKKEGKKKGRRMTLKRKTQIILALLLSSVFLFEGCATLRRGTSQKMPVTISPAGAKIIVDGEEIGHAPLELKLKRKKKIHIIRIEKTGYNPLEIRILRKTSKAPVMGNLLLGGSMAFIDVLLFGGIGSYGGISKTLAFVGAIGGGIFLLTAPFIVDNISGARQVLSPKELNVTLTKQEGNAQPDLILLDARQFRNIKWIRIRCDRSDGEDNFEKN